jgi:phenylacetate-CoA ligase
MREFKIRDFLSIRRILYWRWKLWRSQYYPPEKLKALQWKLFSSMLDHCMEHVAYYRDEFAQLGLRRSDFHSLDDLSKLPVINKWTLLDNFERFKADNMKKFRPSPCITSGSTGTPMPFLLDINSNVIEMTCQWRHFSWTGYRIGQTFADIRNKINPTPEGRRWNWQCRSLHISAPLINASNIGAYAELFKKYKIKFWRGHPSALHHLCLVMNDTGVRSMMPERIVCSGEPVLEYQRSFIESFTGVPICDDFGLFEHTALISQCPQGGYHINPEYGIVEILKEDGSPAKDGEEGRIIGTGLHNRIIPLLRYDTCDYAVQSSKTCSCGRTLPLLEHLTGRFVERLLTADGRWASEMRIAVKYGKGIRMAQFVQEKQGEIDFYIVPNKDGFSFEGSIKMYDELTRYLGETTVLRTHIVSEVPYHEPGKYKFVVNKLASSSNPAESTYKAKK